MRRLSLIVGLALIAVMTVWEVYDFFVTNAGIRYFSSDPLRLVPVVLLGLAGGVVAFGISRLSPGLQRTLKLTALGSLGTILLCALGLFAYSFARFGPMVGEAGGSGWVAAALLSGAVMEVLVWLEFRQVWRRT
jgi:hypothetical protein